MTHQRLFIQEYFSNFGAMERNITEELTEVIKKESQNFTGFKGHNLQRVFDILNKNGISNKSEYSFPLKDTIGKRFKEQSRFK